MSINQKSGRQTFRRRFVSGSLFVSPCAPECNFQSETKIEPDLRLDRRFLKRARESSSRISQLLISSFPRRTHSTQARALGGRKKSASVRWLCVWYTCPFHRDTIEKSAPCYSRPIKCLYKIWWDKQGVLWIMWKWWIGFGRRVLNKDTQLFNYGQSYTYG